MSSKSKRGGRGKSLSERAKEQDVPQPGEEEIEEIKAQADEAVHLLAQVRKQFPRMISELPRGHLVEYLRHGSRRTYARFFKGFRPDRIPLSRMADYLAEEVFKNANGVLAHLIIVLWNEVKSELYEATKKALQVVNPNVELIEKVEPELSREILVDLSARFDREDVAVLCLINDARFDRGVVRELFPEWEWPELKSEMDASKQRMLEELMEARAGEPEAAVEAEEA